MAALRGDVADLRQLTQRNAEFLQQPEAMFAVIRLQRADLATALLDLGMSVNVADDKNFTALHQRIARANRPSSACRKTTKRRSR